MNDYQSYQIDPEVDTPESLDNLRRRYDGALKAEQEKLNKPNINLGGSYHVDTAGGAVRYDNARTVDAPHLDPNTVTINGMTTTRENYEYLKRSGMLSPSDRIVDPFADGPADTSTDGTHNDTDEPVTADDKVIALGDACIETLEEAIGSEAVDHALITAAETGDLDAATPQGVPSQMVNAVARAYEAAADRMLSGSSATVSMMKDCLYPEEQAEARRAFLQGDDQRFRELGQVALDRLADAPEKHPEWFASVCETYLPDLKIRKTADGQTLINADGAGLTTWKAAVIAGLIRI